MNSNTEFDYSNFVSKNKSFLVAPAGYGKTYSISECLKDKYCTGKQLILTHTHAGIASIKSKIKKANITANKYNVETITSFAQKYALSFYMGTDVPEQDNSKEYYPFIISKATEFLKMKPIKDILKRTYNGLFVDEYQDCTVRQHNLILTLAEILPTHILGDHMQGIFNFDEPTIDLGNSEVMGDFYLNKTELLTPWRWKNEGNEALGVAIKTIRHDLENNRTIDLSKYSPTIEVMITAENDIFDFKKDCSKRLWKLRNESSVLLIHHETRFINSRLKIIKKYNMFNLVEAIDDKDFYKIAKDIDALDTHVFNETIYNILIEVFTKTILEKWLNSKGIIKKRTMEDKKISEPIKHLYEEAKTTINFCSILNLFQTIKTLPEIKCHRQELFSSICKALNNAHFNKTTVYESMVSARNTIRRIGRKVDKKCIGTTLLTKGLEFDTVVVLNAHKFDSPKDFYVAISRACKHLIVFTTTMKLSPYKPISTPQL
jgi:DNA helicase IV